MSNLRLVRDFYTALGAGDDGRVREILAPDIVWIQCAGFPGGGTRRGVDEVFEQVFSSLQSSWDDWHVELDEFLDAGDTIVVLGTYHGTHTGTGKSMSAVFAHVYDLGAGQIRRFRQFTDTAPIAAAGRG